MNAEIVYQVFKALPEEEQLKLFKKLKKEFLRYDFSRIKKPEILTQDEAIDYLLNNVFNKKRKP